MSVLRRLLSMDLPHVWLSIFKRLDYQDLLSCRAISPVWKNVIESPKFKDVLRAKYRVHLWLHGKPPPILVTKTVPISKALMYGEVGVKADEHGLVAAEYELNFAGNLIVRKLYSFNADLSQFKELECHFRHFGFYFQLTKDRLIVHGVTNEPVATLYDRWTLEELVSDVPIGSYAVFGDLFFQYPDQAKDGDSCQINRIDPDTGTVTKVETPPSFDSQIMTCCKKRVKCKLFKGKHFVTFCTVCDKLKAFDFGSWREVWSTWASSLHQEGGAKKSRLDDNDGEGDDYSSSDDESWSSKRRRGLYSRSPHVCVLIGKRQQYYDPETGAEVFAYDSSLPPGSSHHTNFESKRFVGYTYILNDERYLVYKDLWSSEGPKEIQAQKLFYRFRAHMECKVILDRLLVMSPSRHVEDKDFLAKVFKKTFSESDQNLDVLDLCAKNPFLSLNRISNRGNLGYSKAMSNGSGFYYQTLNGDDRMMYKLFDMEPKLDRTTPVGSVSQKWRRMLSVLRSFKKKQSPK